MQYESSGHLRIGGCADLEMVPVYSTKYAVGDILYVKEKAKKGKLERVCIKRIIITDTDIPVDPDHYIYKDTFNEIWQEFELITLLEAASLVSEYETYTGETLERIDKCVEKLSS